MDLLKKWILVIILSIGNLDCLLGYGEKMEYFLYTRANPQIKQALFKDDIISVQRSNYDPLRPLRVIVHGFQSNHSSDVNTYIRAAYLESSDVNVISVDWSTGSDRISINYGKSEEDVKTYGKILASFLDFLQSHYNNTFDRTTIVGHSLGAHLAGIAGKYVTGQLDMIMGLDPAGPLYIRLLEYNRISKGDAKYVQIIHTNTANYGFTYPLGDTDFYPNYGATQPECLSDVSTGCSHVMVVKFFAESLTKNGFLASKCAGGYNDIAARICTETSNKVKMVMGGNPPKKARENGVFYLATCSEGRYGWYANRNLLNSCQASGINFHTEPRQQYLGRKKGICEV